jgi:hypothetical protein
MAFAGVGNFYFLWVACNPLKSLESDEGIQENPSPFPWFFLVWLGFGLDGFGPTSALRPSAPGCSPTRLPGRAALDQRRARVVVLQQNHVQFRVIHRADFRVLA